VRIDLHAHSTASDGTLSPAEVVVAARDAGLDVVALTDHDSTRGWDEAAAALPTGVTLVRGAEISCETTDGIPMHLLAYLFDPTHELLFEELENTRDDRIPRAKGIIAKLAADGIPITWEAVLAQVEPGGTVGRPHIADALVVAGAVADRTRPSTTTCTTAASTTSSITPRSRSRRSGSSARRAASPSSPIPGRTSAGSSWATTSSSPWPRRARRPRDRPPRP
jgi:hypothetical protein